MNGFLLIDKPEGMTSHSVVAAVRRLTGIRRVGHTGTLDPMATGVLPIAIGNATRMTEYMLADDKAYTGRFLPGYTSDTYDRTGTVTHCGDPDFSEDELQDTVQKLTGPQQQLPPMYSAKKIKGRKLYELAREGIEIERKTAAVIVYDFQILEASGDEISFYAQVSKGTYIRTLIHDLGRLLSCGAVLTALRRVQSGRFSIDRCIPLAELELKSQEEVRQLLLPADSAISDAPELHVSEEAGNRLANGQRISGFGSDCALVRVYSPAHFLGPGYIEDGVLKLRKVLESKEQII